MTASPGESWRTSSSFFVLFLLVDLPFSFLALIGWAALMGLDAAAITRVVLVTTALRWLTLWIACRRLFGPVDRWRAAAEVDDERVVRAADLALAHGPRRFTPVFALAWVASYAVVTAWVWFIQPEVSPIGPEDLITSAAFLLGTFTGAMTFCFAISTLAVARLRDEVSQTLAARGRARASAPISLARRLGLIIFGLVLAPVSLIGATGWSNEIGFDRYDLVAELGIAVEAELDRLEAGEPLVEGRITEVPPPERTTRDVLPSLDHRVELDRRTGTAAVAAALPGGRWLVVEDSLERAPRGFGTKLIIFCIVLGIYALALALILPLTLITPLRGLEEVVRRLVRVGDILAIEHASVIEDDEIGRLTRCVNDLVDELRGLAGAAQAVAQGKLATELDGSGDLQVAFREMLEQLRTMVGHIREISIEVASSASEILAATRSQELAATQSSAAVTEVSQRVASLAEAATGISSSATKVLSNADQTLATADVVVAKIAELNDQATGIADLLEVIREIAQRSDLLALNGSLEATRAGEAGRGFALVAAEMRRLAERVTHVVVDVHGRISQISLAGAETVSATERSRSLAEYTAKVADEISAATRKQSEDTGYASSSMQSMAEVVVDTSGATIQTRAAAEDLRARLDQLERATQRFELPRAPGDAHPR